MTDTDSPQDGVTPSPPATDQDALIRGVLRPRVPLATRVNRNVLVVVAVIMAATVISAVVVLNPSREAATMDPRRDAPQAGDGTPPSFPTFLNTPPQPAPTTGSSLDPGQSTPDMEHSPVDTVRTSGTASAAPYATTPPTPPSFDPYTAPVPASAQSPSVSPRQTSYAKALTSRPSVMLSDSRVAGTDVYHMDGAGSELLDSMPGVDEHRRASAESSLLVNPAINAFTPVPQSAGVLTMPRVSGKAGHHAFLHSARASETPAIPSALNPAPSRYTIQAGTVIPGLLVTGINSDLPGQILAQVARDVYDSPTQRVVLIPKGAKLLATYDNEILAGQNRVLVAFTRILFPDGRSIALPGLGITDVQGAAGIRDQVDNHYRQVFGNAVLLSVLGAGVQLSQPRQGASVLMPPTAGQVAAGAVGQQLADVGAAIVRKNLDIQPTLVIRPGAPFNVFLNGDLTFDGPYVDTRVP